MSGFTTAEVEEVVPMGGPARWALRVVTDRELATRGLTKGKAAPLLVADSLPELFRNAATIAEQGDGTLDCIAAALRETRS